MQEKKTKKTHSVQTGRLPKLLILAGIIILVVMVFVLKNKPEPAPDLAGKSAEEQLDWYLENEQPVFIFFHSTTCKTCTDMMAVVDQVYPAYKEQVGLVDVDVYATWNQDLLQRARITNIPTQIFVNGKGEGMTVIGGMQPDELSTELQALADGVDHGN